MGLAGAQKGTASIAETEVWHASWEDLRMGRKARSLEGLEWSGELFEGSEGRPGREARDVHRHEECYFAPTCNGKVALLWANAHVAYSGLCKDGYQRVTLLLC